MLDFEKIRLMTDLAIYEKNNREKVFKVNEYYRFDYIVGHMAAAFLRFSLCFIIVFVFYIVFRADDFFYNVNLSGITDTLGKAGILYLTGLGIYLVITLIVCICRYNRARKGILMYAARLKRLGRKYYYRKSEEN